MGPGAGPIAPQSEAGSLVASAPLEKRSKRALSHGGGTGSASFGIGPSHAIVWTPWPG
jgi:hypothetical protein